MDDTMDNLNMSPTLGTKNKDLQGLGKEQPKQYGMTQNEISDIVFDVSILDQMYEKWA